MDQRPAGSGSTAGSERLHEAATGVFPGGVSHNVRAADPYPVYIERSEGQHLIDVDGNRYVDFWNDHGASLLGHAPTAVVEAVREQAADGLHFGAVNEPTLELARKALEFIPGADTFRFAVTGTEATMYAVRLARAHTGRDRVLKVEGGWHGGNTDLAHGVNPPFDAPTSHGLPPGPAEHVHTFRLNDDDGVAELFERHGDEVAAAIVDPRQAGTEPDAAFLRSLADRCADNGALFVLDEVVTGFRVSPGTYGERVGIEPDLTTLGKVLGGGMPVGAIAGRAELFAPAAPGSTPEERVLAAGGTYSANPLTAVAGLATLEAIESEPVHDHTEALGERAREGLRAVFEELGVEGEPLGFSSLLQPVLNPDRPLDSPTDVKTGTDGAALKAYHRGLLERGYYFNQGSMGNVSYAMTEADVEGFLETSHDVLAELLADGVV
ncbi:MAG: aminotransferase class III-fold pyridoxal phosphate-dependent enzyme [Halobacteriales archaeon]|nr:aminotransferase class III-fold pyridoxal phosphate-dependent enzyme [Halobacteriales archaeon]